MPERISYVVIALIRKQKRDNSSATFINNRNNILFSTKQNENSSFYTLLTDTVTSNPMKSTENPVSSFREGDTIQFTCTGNIGKPPGKFIWQIIPQQGEPIVYYNETTVVVDQIPDTCSFRGTSNLTVEITADHLKAKVRCFEESLADVKGMFVETEPLDVYYTVREPYITKQPNQEQYDKKTPLITLTCKGDGNPQPTYKWFRQENRRRILSSTNLYIIEDVVQNNSGVYICEVYNTIDEIEYNANSTVKIDIVDKLSSSTESESLKISAVNLILIICAVVIGALVVALVVRKFHCNRHNEKTKEQNCCQKQMDYLLGCCCSNVSSTTDNNVPLTELKDTSDVKQENKSNFRSSGEDKNQVTTVDINPQLETDSIYADPSDAVNQSAKTDLDIRYLLNKSTGDPKLYNSEYEIVDTRRNKEENKLYLKSSTLDFLHNNNVSILLGIPQNSLAEQFWTLIDDHCIENIILLVKKNEKVSEFYPTLDDIFKMNNFEISLDSAERTHKVIMMLTFNLQNKDDYELCYKVIGNYLEAVNTYDCID
ncbi:Hypothetical predicted protein [Mytilus galloprovincialis]|nr:Hypothetical predicted protein [Mytilus galloprovincialis]